MCLCLFQGERGERGEKGEAVSVSVRLMSSILLKKKTFQSTKDRCLFLN